MLRVRIKSPLVLQLLFIGSFLDSLDKELFLTMNIWDSLFLLCTILIAYAVRAESADCVMGDSADGNNMPSTPPPCYAFGPLSATPLLPQSKAGERKVVGTITCEEVTAYIMALNRYYDRMCVRMRSKCAAKYQYAASWFNQVGQDMMAKCAKKS
ncbi:uncharacterized protein LOC129770589 [Toxorhynchites rutilus septentrionalis]|uniref:uncharacterized protein LOC129770589 n=1 Tax=Toxorhynchites rutilus septentrionalis TaxID=329112 RepID=UPI00247B1EE2|nr:uncharacterized protein LOC129770589 [Toxorhynchites rutilus septentrionalis]